MATMEDLFGDEPMETIPSHPSNPNNNNNGEQATMNDLFGDDDNDETMEQPQVTVTDLFGEDDNETNTQTNLATNNTIAPTTTQRTSPNIGRRGGNITNVHGKSVLYLPAFPRLASVSAPSSPSSTTASTMENKKVSLVRLPRIVGVAPSMYNHETYNEATEDEYLVKVDKTTAKEALIRYRLKTIQTSNSSTTQYVVDSHGRPQRESNSRVVEWSDGSLTLHVGTEVFSLRRANKASDKNDASGTTSGDYNYIYSLVTSANSDVTSPNNTKSTKETILESQAVVSTRLVAGAIAGSGLINQSVLEARAARSRAVKRSRVTQISLTEDPEIEKQRRIKQEEELQRMRIMQKRKAEEVQRKSGGNYDKELYGTGGDDDDAMMEDNNDEGTVNLGALKKNARNARKKPVSKSRYDSDDDDSDDSDDDDSDDSDDDDSDE